MFIDSLVTSYGLWGAGIMYGIAMIVVMLILGAVLVLTLFGGEKNGRVATKDIS
jgi:hypothetical protein